MRPPDLDYPHGEEFEAAEAATMRPTFSRTPEDGTRFVQGRIAKESDEVWAALEASGRVYICDKATAWLHALIESGYFVEDVWTG